MKPASSSIIITFLLFAFITKFPLAFSNDVEKVLSQFRKPIFEGGKYHIYPEIQNERYGGLTVNKTKDLECPVTVMQGYEDPRISTPVKLTVLGKSSGVINTGTPLEIEFITKPDCAESSKWLVFVDDVIQKSCVGIGGPKNYPNKQILSGTFSIEKYNRRYKLRFCASSSSTCLYIGRLDKFEAGMRLILTEDEPAEVVLVDADDLNDEL